MLPIVFPIYFIYSSYVTRGCTFSRGHELPKIIMCNGKYPYRDKHPSSKRVLPGQYYDSFYKG